VPIDDTHCWIFGLRHFSDELEKQGIGNKALVGRNSLDIYGQTGERPYEEMQRNTGDWEAEVSQRPIAIHGAENRGSTDRGVIQLRRSLLRALDEAPSPTPAVDGVVPTWTSNTVMTIPERAGEDDRDMLGRIGRAVVDAVIAADGFAPTDRAARIAAALKEIPARIG
jgi:hypothetical protein